MLRSITVTGSRTNTLYHMLKHYTHLVEEMWVIVYEWEGFSTYDDVIKITSQFPNAVVKRSGPMEKFNWNHVTDLYNKYKNEHPNDWWIVSDDDEFHVYSRPLNVLLNECDVNGWEIVRGGFIDRIGPNGTFPEIDPKKYIFEQFPIAGFFRYPLSGACPNKICLTKGHIKLTPGQHYAEINGQSTWRWQGWNHPLIHPIASVQVHHFKWDSTCGERIREVANQNKEHSYSEEYRVMYRALAKTRFQIDITNPEFMFEQGLVYPEFSRYRQWNKLFNIIKSI